MHGGRELLKIEECLLVELGLRGFCLFFMFMHLDVIIISATKKLHWKCMTGCTCGRRYHNGANASSTAGAQVALLLGAHVQEYEEVSRYEG